MASPGPYGIARAGLTIGTRASPLALAQTELVAAALAARHPGLAIASERITTRGDVVLDRPLAAIDGKGLFIAEIEDALRGGRIDLAVHSAKDLPSAVAPGLCLMFVLARADARDVLVPRVAGTTLDGLPAGARVGTGSPRRVAQLRARRPDLDVVGVRGNVGTRLRRLDEGACDALVLAAAGLDRLGLAARASERFAPDVMIPAPGQGAIAVELRADAADVAALVAPLVDRAAADAVAAERAFLAAVGGGCSVPVAAHAVVDAAGTLVLRGLVATPDGRAVRATVDGASEDAVALGRRLADVLLAGGGAALLAESAGGGADDRE